MVSCGFHRVSPKIRNVYNENSTVSQTVATSPAKPLDADAISAATLLQMQVSLTHLWRAIHSLNASQRRPCEHDAQKSLSDTASGGGAIEVPPVFTPPSLSEGQENELLEKQKAEEDFQDVLRMSYDESLEFHPKTVRFQASRNFAETTLRNHRLMRKILERERERDM